MIGRQSSVEARHGPDGHLSVPLPIAFNNLRLQVDRLLLPSSSQLFLLINSFHKYLLSTYCMPSTILGAGMRQTLFCVQLLGQT